MSYPSATIKLSKEQEMKMDKYQKIEAILDKFKAECEANGHTSYAIAYARAFGALHAYVTDETADSLYTFYIGENN